MALSENVKISLKIEAAGAANTVGELKKALKELKDAAAGVEEGSRAFQDLGNAAAAAKDRIDDINDAVKASAGEPIEKVAGSVGLLGDKLKGLDFKGASAALKGLSANLGSINFKGLTAGVGEFGKALLGVGKAILTNPLFLLVGVIVGIGAAMVALKDKVKFISDAFEFLGDVLSTVTDFFKDLSDSIFDTTFAAQDAAEKQIKAYQDIQKSVEKRYDREIALAQAAGKKTEEIEIAKERAVRKAIDGEMNAIVAKANLVGKLNDEEAKQLEELGAKREASILKEEVARAKQYKDLVDGQVKANEDKDKANKEAADKAKKAREDEARTALDQLKKTQELELLGIEKGSQEAVDIRTRQLAEEVALLEKYQKALKLTDLDIKLTKEKGSQDILDTQKAFNEKEIAENKAKNDKIKADNKSVQDAAVADILAGAEAKVIAQVDGSQAELDAKLAQLQLERDTKLAFEAETENQKALIIAQYEQQVFDLKKENIEKEKALELEKADAAIQLGAATFSSLQSLSDTYFSIKEANTSKDSANAEKNARKQFALNKGLSIGSTIIAGAQGVVNALGAKSVLPEPAATIAKAINVAAIVATTAASVAKIAATQFKSSGDGGGASAGGAVASGGGGGAGPSAASLPRFTPPDLEKNPRFGNLPGLAQPAPNGQQGQTPVVPVVKAIVVTQDITTSQNQQEALARRTSF